MNLLDNFETKLFPFFILILWKIFLILSFS